MSDCSVRATLNQVFDQLTVAEAIPVIGVIPSAAKGLIALAVMVTSLALLVLVAPLHLLSAATLNKTNCLYRNTYTWFADTTLHAKTGASMLLHALLNIETLGLMQTYFSRTTFLPSF